MSIITIGEHQDIKNNHVCSFCGNENKPVVGRAYSQWRSDFPSKHYMFSYCTDCAVVQAEMMAKVSDPSNKVVRGQM